MRNDVGSARLFSTVGGVLGLFITARLLWFILVEQAQVTHSPPPTIAPMYQPRLVVIYTSMTLASTLLLIIAWLARRLPHRTYILLALAAGAVLGTLGLVGAASGSPAFIYLVPGGMAFYAAFRFASADRATTQTSDV